MKKTVLFVSTNNTLVMFMGILINRMGFEIISAKGGPEAVDIVGTMHPDVIIVDSEMAEFDGLHILEYIRGIRTDAPPIILLVGSITDEAVKRCIRAGAATVIFKPIIPEELQSALQECVFTGSGARRKHVRAKADLRVKIFHEGKEQSLLTESLSAGGAFIRHDEPLEVGNVIDIFMPLGEQECLFISGKVIYNQKPCQSVSGICPGFAVKFVNIGERETESIREFVLTLLTGDITGLQEGTSSGRGGNDVYGKRSAADVYAAIHSYAGKQVMRRKGTS
jgi:CheY-like chemotaxis protein/Tfp pilus assembly protein PilZ